MDILTSSYKSRALKKIVNFLQSAPRPDLLVPCNCGEAVGGQTINTF